LYLSGLNEVEKKWVKDGIQISTSAANGVLSGILRIKEHSWGVLRFRVASGSEIR
jgi:hypothetical protein